MNVREEREALARRVQLLMWSACGLLGVIAIGFWSVQISGGEYYRDLAENNRLRKVPIEAPRGLMLDRHGRILAENIPSYNLTIDLTRTGDLEESLAFAAEVVGRPVDELAAASRQARGASRFRPVLLVEGLTLAQVARFSLAGLEHPEFEIEVRQTRLYRHGRQTAHVLGHLGEVSEEDLARRPGTYSPGDLVGRKGVEAAYDELLRGSDGERVVVVDSRGKPLNEYGREVARPGRNLTLTIDLDLQQTAERLLRDRVGAVVALDPADGAVRVLVSSPSYDPNLFTRRLGREEWIAITQAPDHPLQNRAIGSAFSPGSVFKIVMAAAGLDQGTVTTGHREHCSGQVRLYDRRFRCWKRSGHGWVDLHQAIQRSCDVYFYALGQKLGVDIIGEYSRRFGLGGRTGIDLAGEVPGLVPGREWSRRVRDAPWYPGETISVAIGQGPLDVTPLQVATLMAAMANGGRLVRPHLLAEGGPVGDEPIRRLELPQTILAPINRALWAVVNETGGSAVEAALPELPYAGKTGTAQVISQATWTRNEDLPREQRDHAWFAAYGPYDDPQLAVVVFIEHGGTGSTAAAPVARALFAQLLEGRDVAAPDRLANR